MHWAAKYIGRPWVNGAQGPEAFDCWGLVRFVLREQRGIALPVVDVDAGQLRQVARIFTSGENYAGWQQVEQPNELDGVLMSHAKHPHHVGIWIDADGGQVLHCIEGAGVVAMNRLHLRLAGWNIISFWRHSACKHP